MLNVVGFLVYFFTTNAAPVSNPQNLIFHKIIEPRSVTGMKGNYVTWKKQLFKLHSSVSLCGNWKSAEFLNYKTAMADKKKSDQIFTFLRCT